MVDLYPKKKNILHDGNAMGTSVHRKGKELESHQNKMVNGI